MSKLIYLDNAATTRPFSEVCDLVTRVMYEDFGNPSSLHMKGVIAERYVRQAREQIAKTLKCAAKNIVFTSGGTESNNMALIGSALANARASTLSQPVLSMRLFMSRCYI